jgi:cytochrome c
MLIVVGPAEASEQLMSRSGCFSCHAVEEKLLGPSFQDIAARYRADAQAPAHLFSKVREGSEGQWGDLPMPPNTTEKISDDDLRALLAWLLQLQR